MALRIDIDRNVLERALEAQISSYKRSIAKQPNGMIVQLVQKDIAIITTAINTITEVK